MFTYSCTSWKRHWWSSCDVFSCFLSLTESEPGIRPLHSGHWGRDLWPDLYRYSVSHGSRGDQQVTSKTHRGPNWIDMQGAKSAAHKLKLSCGLWETCWPTHVCFALEGSLKEGAGIFFFSVVYFQSLSYSPTWPALPFKFQWLYTNTQNHFTLSKQCSVPFAHLHNLIRVQAVA